MAQQMTRGAIQDRIDQFVAEHPEGRAALIADPKGVLETQLHIRLGAATVQALVETPDTVYIVVPYGPTEEELGNADLGQVAGGYGMWNEC